jgi:hypothetical protein
MPFANLRQPIVADDEFAKGILPSKGALHFVAQSIQPPIKPAEHPSNRDRRLGIAAIGIDHRLHVVSFDNVLGVLGVKASIQRDGRASEINANLSGEVHQRGQGFRQNDGVLLIDGLHGERTDHETLVVYDRQFFFTFLVLMTRIAEAPFFTTVLEPSPWRTEVSS